jgi:hypothetical protein
MRAESLVAVRAVVFAQEDFSEQKQADLLGGQRALQVL